LVFFVLTLEISMSTFIHEASHAVILMSYGHPVFEIMATEYLGEMKPSPTSNLSYECRVVMAQAGCVAELSFTNSERLEPRSTEPSSGDLAYIQNALDEAAAADVFLDERKCLRLARQLVNQFVEPITFLAEILQKRGRLMQSAIGELCREPGSPLAQFAHLYPKPTAAPLVKRRAPALMTNNKNVYQRVTVTGCMRP
jgi:hypothetical protein